MHNNIAQKFVDVEFRFVLLFVPMDFNDKKQVKNGNFIGFWRFSQKVFDMIPRDLVYRFIVNTFKCVWQMAPVGRIVGPFLSPNVFVYFIKKLPLDSHEIWFKGSLEPVFVGVKEAPETQISSPFWASKWVKIQVFHYFVEKFPLDSQQSCFISSLELLSEMCTTQFLGHFGPQSKSKFWTLVTFSKSFHWFYISIAAHAHCEYFQLYMKYGPQRPNFGAIFGTQISKNSSLWSFSQKSFHWFRISLGLHVNLSYFSRYVEYRLGGQISGSISSPKYNMIHVFSHFLNIFHWFHILLVLHAYWLHFKVYFRLQPNLFSCQASCFNSLRSEQHWLPFSSVTNFAQPSVMK